MEYEINPIITLRSENKNKNLKHDCKNTGYIKGQDRTEYYTLQIKETPFNETQFLKKRKRIIKIAWS